MEYMDGYRRSIAMQTLKHFGTMTLQYFLPEAVAQTTDFPGTRGNVMQGHEIPKAREW